MKFRCQCFREVFNKQLNHAIKRANILICLLFYALSFVKLSLAKEAPFFIYSSNYISLVHDHVILKFINLPLESFDKFVCLFNKVKQRYLENFTTIINICDWKNKIMYYVFSVCLITFKYINSFSHSWKEYMFSIFYFLFWIGELFISKLKLIHIQT